MLTLEQAAPGMLVVSSIKHARSFFILVSMEERDSDDSRDWFGVTTVEVGDSPLSTVRSAALVVPNECFDPCGRAP